MRNLAIARAGDNSKHETWISDRSKKNFDLLVSYYGDVPDKWKGNSDIYHREKGLKYPWFDAYLRSNPEVLDYDAVWLCDDDLEAPTDTISDMFDLFHEYRLDLGQGAQSLQSFVSHPHLRCKPGYLLRYVGFIEEQMPIFSKTCLRKVWHTMGLTKSGWGLGIAWANVLGHPQDKMAVIDATPIDHLRQLQSGEMYTQVLPTLGVTARDELEAMKAKYHDDMRFEEFGGVRLEGSDPLTKMRHAKQVR